MNYRKFTVNELVLDENFKSWVKNPTGEQDKFWSHWLELNPDKLPLIDEARKIVLTLSIDKDDPFNEELEELWNRIEKTNAESEEVVPLYKAPSLFTRISKIAAVFAGIIIIGTLIYLSSGILNTQKFRTAYGETQIIALPDGSQVTLNSNSFIKYDKNLGESQLREIWLEGEAYFSVVHKSENQKFIVHTSNLNIEVLGTQFNVNNRKGKTSVVLNTGKVKLELLNNVKEKEIFMKPGDLVVFLEENKSFTKASVHPEDFNAWSGKKLVFKDNSLREISQTLLHNYGIEVIFGSDELSELRFTGTIQAKNINIFVVALEKALNLEASLKGNQLIINNKQK